MDKLYTELRNSDDVDVLERLLREYTKVEVNFVNLNSDSDDWYSFIVGDYLIRILREKEKKGSKFKYNISELHIHDIVDGYNETISPEHSFENVDIKRFERVLDLLMKKNGNFFGIVINILKVFEENGYENADFSDFAEWPNSLALDDGDIIYISRYRNKIRLERLTQDFDSYNQKLILKTEEFNGGEYRDKVKEFIEKFSSPDRFINTLKECSDAPSTIVGNIAKYVKNHCMDLVGRVSPYGCESIFVCGEHTVIVRYLAKYSTYNVKDFEDKNGFHPVSNSVENGEVTYSIGDGFELSDNFKKLNGKALEKLKEVLNNKNEYSLCKLFEDLQERVMKRHYMVPGFKDVDEDCDFMVGNITMESGIYLMYNKREIKFKLNKSKIVIVYIDSEEVEELNFELNDSDYTEAFDKIIDYVKN